MMVGTCDGGETGKGAIFTQGTYNFEFMRALCQCVWRRLATLETVAVVHRLGRTVCNCWFEVPFPRPSPSGNDTSLLAVVTFQEVC